MYLEGKDPYEIRDPSNNIGSIRIKNTELRNKVILVLTYYG